jgi:copper chaperone CopZ
MNTNKFLLSLIAIVLVFALLIGVACAKVVTKTLRVNGMTCGGCSASVERALKKVDGVLDAKAKYGPKGTVWVKYDDKKIDLAKIKKIIEDAGFEVVDRARGSLELGPIVDHSDRVSFYGVPLVCKAAPEIGCGSRAKPILKELEQHHAVAEALLNRSGTLIAIVWSEDSTMAQRAEAIAAVEQKGVQVLKLSDGEREAALKEFASKANWYRSSEVDRLSEEEGDIIAARLVRRVQAKVVLSEEQADKLRRAISAAFKRCILGPAQKVIEEELLSAGREYLSGEGIEALKEAIRLGYRPLPGEK